MRTAYRRVEEQILDEGQTLLGVMVFPYRFGRAELEHGLPPRLGGRHAGGHWADDDTLTKLSNEPTEKPWDAVPRFSQPVKNAG